MTGLERNQANPSFFPHGDIMNEMTQSHVCPRFSGFLKVVCKRPLVVTRRGRPLMVLLSPDQYEGLQITIEILRDRAYARELWRTVVDGLESKR